MSVSPVSVDCSLVPGRPSPAAETVWWLDLDVLSLTPFPSEIWDGQ